MRKRLFLILICMITLTAPVQPTISQTTDPAIREIEVPAFPAQTHAGAGAVWVAHRGDTELSKLDPTMNQSIASFDLPGRRPSVGGMATNAGRFWVADLHRKRIYRLHTETGEVLDEIRTRGRIYGLWYAAGSLWYADAGTKLPPSQTLVRINPKTHRVLARFSSGGENASFGSLVPLGGTIWLLRNTVDHVAGNGPNFTFYVKTALWGIDPDRNEVTYKNRLGATLTRGSVNPVIGDVHRVGKRLWLSWVQERRLTEMNPFSGRVTKEIPIHEFELPWNFAFSDGFLWVGDLNDSEVARIDPGTKERAFFEIDAETSFIGNGFGSIWVPTPRGDVWNDPGSVIRIDYE